MSIQIRWTHQFFVLVDSFSLQSIHLGQELNEAKTEE